MAKTRGAGRAHRFHGGDHVALAVEMALHGIGDADAAHQQSGEPDQREILREALDVSLKLRRGIAPAADFPSGVRQLRLRCVDDRLDGLLARVVFRQAQAIAPAHKAARLQQAGGAQGFFAHQQARAEIDAASELVWFAAQHRANFEIGRAHRDAVAGLQSEAREQGRRSGRAEGAIALGQQCGQIQRAAPATSAP